MRCAALLLLASTIASTAQAQAPTETKPPTSPTRDVDVVYRALAGGKPVEQRSRFAPSQGRIRIDTPSPGLYVIVDRRDRTMQMVSSGDRSVLDMPFDPARTVAGVPTDHGFIRVGSDTVAQTPCMDWQTTDAAGHPLTVCLTTDGLMLRARSGANVLVEAVRVAYGPIDPSVFAVPREYQHHDASAR